MGAGIPVNSRAIGWPKILLINDQDVVHRGGEKIEFMPEKNCVTIWRCERNFIMKQTIEKSNANIRKVY
jgi:hypothetical protein